MQRPVVVPCERMHELPPRAGSVRVKRHVASVSSSPAGVELALHTKHHHQIEKIGFWVGYSTPGTLLGGHYKTLLGQVLFDNTVLLQASLPSSVFMRITSSTVHCIK